MMDTRTDSGTTLLRTGIKHTAAAHMVVDGEPITVAWSTIPIACSDWVLGDVSSQGPVCQEPDQPPAVWKSGNSTRSAWQPRTEVQCGRCGQMVGPWALVSDGHLDDDELADLALEVAEHADYERERQRRELIDHLADEAEDVANRLADGDLERSEVPDVRAMSEPGVGIDGDEIVAWGCLPALDGSLDDEIVEVTRPLPTGCR